MTGPEHESRTTPPARPESVPNDDSPPRSADPAPADSETPPDPNRTWDPSQADPFDGFASWRDTPSERAHADSGWSRPADVGTGAGSPGRSGFRPEPAPGPLPRAPTTNRPKADNAEAKTSAISDVWNDDFDSMTPAMTLKGPGQVRPPAPAGRRPAAPGMVAPHVQLDGYELLKVLGEGGVGVVYEAIQKCIDRTIAVKMIKPGVGPSPSDQEKFLAEAMVTGALDHPNIVPIHDLGRTRSGDPFYAMKMVRGTPWSDTIRTAGLHDNLRVLLDVCDAVAFAHSKNVIHRDLKPENVMLGEFGEVQLMDWGLGLAVDDHGEATTSTNTQAAGGTPAYMAPEMVTGEDGPVGRHSDIYLLGAILYEIVTGKPPHEGVRVLDCLMNARDNVIQPTTKRGVLVDIALQAMATDPSRRHPTVAVFKQAIVQYQTHAESINLAQRAAADLTRAKAIGHYETFAQALFGFREALKLWPENADACAGVVETQRAYARCAFDKDDFDLAASNLDPDEPTHQALAREIAVAQRRRALARRRLRLFRTAAIVLTGAVIVILTGASIWIAIEKHEADQARAAAEAAWQAEALQRGLAETARTKAEAEEARAVQALADLEQAVKDMMEARTNEEKALARARTSELVAVETRDELARTGMLLDNSWWVFDADEARARQERAAAALVQPVTLTVTLPGDTPLELVLIPPGDFAMGSPPKEEQRAAEEYLHRVHHSRPLYLGRCEFTEAQWVAVAGALPGSGPQDARAPDHARPVVGASRPQIVDVLLPALQCYAPPGYRFRLPTEAEWEYACRAGTATAYHTGDGPAALAAAGWYVANSGRTVQPVGRKQPNAFGLYDMHGNVGEICADEFAPHYYLDAPISDPFNDVPGEKPVVRGGSVLNTPEHCRAAYRSYAYEQNEYEFVGLRVALVPEQGSR